MISYIKYPNIFKTALSICVFFSFPIFTIISQYYDISAFTVYEGLTDNLCSRLYCDSVGNIWALSEKNGVSKLTGKYIHKIDRQDGLSDNRIFDILEFQDAIWFATGNGISKYNGSEFKNFLNNSKIGAFACGDDKKIYFYDETKGIGIFQNEKVLFLDLIKDLKNLQVNRLFIDKSQNIYIATENKGFVFLRGNTIHFFNKKDGLNDNRVYDFHQFSDKEILISTARGINIFNGELIEKATNYKLLDNQKVYCIAKDSKNFIWFGTEKGAYHFRKNEMTFLNKSNKLTSPVYSIVEDKERGIWFGTKHGAFRLNNQFSMIYTSEHGLTDNRIYGLCLDKNGNIWIGTKKGINIFHKKKINTVLKTFSTSIPFLSDEKNNILVSAEKGIYIWRDDKLIRYVISENKRENFNTGTQISSGEILLGGNHGLKIFDGRKFDNFISRKNIKESIINAVIQTENGAIWIGTEEQGLFKLEKYEFKHFTIENGLPSNTINCFTVDKDNNLWVGTGNGIFKIRESNTRYGFTSFEEIELTSSSVYALYCDKNNDIWVGTNSGLNKIIIYENDLLRINHYGRQQGFNKLQVNSNAITGDTNRIYVGTSSGLVVINPDEGIFSDKAPHIRISNVRLHYKEVNWKDLTDDLVPGYNVPRSATLLSDQDHLTIDFEAIGHNIPQMITYQWKLKGFEEDWSKSMKINTAIYRELPSGNYIFMVKACNGSGICSEKSAEFSFEINKPFYQKRTFIVSLLVAIVFIVAGYIRMRMLTLKIKQEKLEKQVRRRTTEIVDQKNKIEIQGLKLAKALQEIDHKNNELTKINNKITDNIVYARKIQDAVIFLHNDFQKIFEKTFVFLRCKTIVSSDFYWAWEKENTIFIALADCTGYGVPGALMSLIGAENLKQTLNEHAEKDPANILLKFNEKITNALNLENETQQINEAIDISLCKIDKKTHQMTFAGANSRLIYLQNKELYSIKGDFLSIGIQFKDVKTKFTNHKIDISIPTNIYLFSGGFCNQFGGEENKKYKLSNFKNLIASISEYDFNKQNECLQEELDRWKKNRQQTDDILIIGFQYNRKRDVSIS